MAKRPVLHKALRPKADYLDPSLCAAFGDNLFGRLEWIELQCRSLWKDVTCRRCLKIKVKR